MTIEEIFSRFDEGTILLAKELRTYLLKHIPGVLEIPDGSANLVGYGYGTGYKDLICVIMLSKKGVKLGLNRGASLPDPKKLLTGTGKVHRYVEITTMEDVKKPEIRALINEAVTAYRTSLLKTKPSRQKK